MDTSALVAIFLLEQEAERFTRAIQAARAPMISAANLLETSIVLDGRIGDDSSPQLDAFIADVGLSIEPVTIAQARIARAAYRSYGRGYHAAGLNFGDCFAYALAKATRLPLLFKGNDFARTDITAY